VAGHCAEPASCLHHLCRTICWLELGWCHTLHGLHANSLSVGFLILSTAPSTAEKSNPPNVQKPLCHLPLGLLTCIRFPHAMLVCEMSAALACICALDAELHL
jgi:hypothetical protein